MQNWYAIEHESEFRRREWERAVWADNRAAEALSTRPRLRWTTLPHLALARMRSLTAPRLPLTAALEPDCRTVPC